MAYENDYNSHIASKYKHIHDEVISQINIQHKAKKDVVIAQQMQRLLYKIKNLRTIPKDAMDARFIEQAKLLIDDSLVILNANRKKGNELSSNTLFHRSHGTSTSYGGDDIFEEELAALFTAIEVRATDKQIVITDKIVGNQLVNVFSKQMDEIIKDTMSKGIKNTIQELNKKYNVKQSTIYSKPEFRSGKIDINGTSTIEAKADVNPIIKQMFTLFQGKTFSLKNYRSDTQTPRLDLYLGNTNYYKAVYGTLSSLGYSKRYIDKVFYSSLNKINKGDSEFNYVASHFYHLRFVYELSGVGLYDENGEPISGVDFLIYNDPVTENIFVQSTAKMIMDELTINRNRFDGTIKVSKRIF